ncbi:hypothetical protein MHYP_G00130780 [Metynnis hypsauchen]
MMDGVMEEDDGEGEVVMVGLAPADLDEDADGPVCFTELKPSTTLLVPLELATEHQEILGGGALHALAGEEPEEPLPGGSDTFSLMLDAGDEEEEKVASEVEPSNQITQHPEHMESQPVANPDVLCVECTEVPHEFMEKMEDLPTAKAEPVVLAAPDVEQPEKLEVLEVKPMQMLESASAGEKGAHSHLNEGRENGDIKDSASAEDEDDEKVPDEKKAHGRTICHKDVAVEANKLSTAGMEVIPVAEDHANRFDEGASHQNDKLKEALKPSEEHPEAPSRDEVAEDKQNKAETVQQSPSRRGKKAVKFPLLITDFEKDLSDEESKVPSTPRRVTRGSKQLQDLEIPVTPRRSTRKTELELLHGLEMPSTKSSKPSSPSRTPQKATPRKGTRRTRNTNVGSDEEPQSMEESVINNVAVPQVRQSTRKTLKSSVDIPEPHHEVPEEKAPEEPPKASASPSRVTRKSTRGLSLALESFQKDSAEDTVAPNQSVVTPPRSRRKTRAGTAEKANNITFVVDEAQLQSVSRRLTRSQLWSHEEEPKKEEHLVLEAPLDVESANPLANALMERLQDDGVKGGEVVTEIVRAKRRTTKSVSENQNKGVDVPAEEVSTETQEPTKKANVRRTRASKVPEPDSSPVTDSFAFTSSLQQTRGRKKDSAKTDISASETLPPPPVTRTRRATAVAEEHHEDQFPSNDVAVPIEEVKTKKKRTTRTRAAPEPVPPVEVDLVSPLASPAQPAQPAARTLKRAEEKDEPFLKMSLRRKRVMETVFPKPVTRRKKL